MQQKIKELINQLKSPNEVAQKEAIWLLGKLGNIEALPPLTEALLHNQYPSNRELAAKALGDLGSKDASYYLCEALKDQSLGVRRQAIIAMGKLGDTQCIEPLKTVLAEPELKVDAALSIGLLGDPHNIIEAIQDQNYSIAAQAAQCAGLIKDPKISPALIKALSSDDWHVRRNAAESLGKLREKEALSNLLKIVAKDKSSEVKSVAVESVGKIGDETCVDVLIKALSDANWEVRKNAAEALGRIGSPKSVRSLIKALEDPDWNTRFNALNSLELLRAEDACPSIITSLNDESKNVRSQAAKVLAELWKDKAREPIQSHLAKEKDPWVISYLSKVLEELPAGEDKKEYKALLVDDDKFISRLLIQTFEMEKFKVANAHNGKEALLKAEEFLPDIIILDVMMPEMDGWEVCEQLKMNPKTSSIPIIMLTAKSQDKDIQKGRTLGVAHYFSKPFNSLELINSVKDILSRIKG